MKESLQNVGDLIAEPGAAFSRLKSQPRSGIAFIIFYLFSVLLLWAVAPYTQQVMSGQMEQSDAPSEQLQTMAQVMGVLIIFLGPVFAILWFIVSSALLKLGARFLLKNETLKFRHIYAAVLHISLISCLIQLVNTALLIIFRDVGDVKSQADFKMIPGLHMLFDSGTNAKLLVFFSHINPLSLWLIAVMAIAIAVLADMAKNRARVAAVILWIISILPEVISAS
ncbi:MAG: YIP1 family protein [Candidatus Poribacteria bacterium]|nr:YIP1 family protein [Candidatus Poribacteria bacterium]